MQGGLQRVSEVLEPLKSGCKLKLGASTRSYEASTWAKEHDPP